MRLARIFQSGMTLQCFRPVRIWGESEKAGEIAVLLNGEPLAKVCVSGGKFSFYLPPCPPQEDATLQIGDILLDHVDFGEVWLAGGQSNMHFYLKWDAEREELYKLPEDAHFRYYEVGKYTFEGEREEGIKDGSRWDHWVHFSPENRPYFSAVAAWFATFLRRELHIPVAIVSCSIGGTSASTWMDEELLKADPLLKVYTEEYEKSVEGLNVERYQMLNRMVRAYSAQGAEAAEDYMYGKTGVTQEMFNAFLAGNAISAPSEPAAPSPAGDLPLEELLRKGPNDPHPGSLYRTMVSEVKYLTCRGVIWYQGCTDEAKPTLYSRLFSALIENWRRDHGERLPFIFAQLAPFGSWMDGVGTNYPEVRRQQAEVARTVPDVYMVSTSDVGCEVDIHPKYKKPVGRRMALQALDKIYGRPTLSDAPTLFSAERKGEELLLTFLGGKGLYVKGDALSAMHAFADERETEFAFRIEQDALILRSEVFAAAKSIRLAFAETAYYNVNLYNGAGIPAFPFTVDKEEV